MMLTLALSALSTLQPLSAASAADATPLEVAAEAFQKGEYKLVLETAAGLAPGAAERPKVQYLAGEALLLLERPAEAKQSFEAVLAARPKATPARVGLARALTRTGELEGAGELFARILDHEPKDVGALVGLGELQTRLEHYGAALESLGAALALAPDDVQATRALFEAQLRSGDNLAAAGLAERTMQRRPEHPLGHFLLAVVMERDGADEDAALQYQAALERDGTFLDAHKNLAILCHTLSDDYEDKDRVRLAYAHYARYFELGGGDESLRATYEQLLQFKDQLLGT